MRDLPKPGRRPTVSTEEMQLQVSLGFIDNPHLSIRQSARINKINKESVRKIL